MIDQPEKSAAEGAPRIVWSEMIAEHVGGGVSVAAIERGYAGVGLMPVGALVAGAGPTRQDPTFDIDALIRTHPALPETIVEELELYAGGEGVEFLAMALEKAERPTFDDVAVRDRLRWHAAHNGDRRAANALHAEAHLTGNATHRAYAGALLLRVARYGDETRWSTGIDHELLRAGLEVCVPQGVVDHALTENLLDTLRGLGPTDPTWNERRRIGTRHPQTIPLSPREIAELDHDYLTVHAGYELRREGQYNELSDDWRTEGSPPWKHGAAMEDAAENARRLKRLKALAAKKPSTAAPEDAPASVPPHHVGAMPAVEENSRRKKKATTPRLWVVDVPRDAEAARLVQSISGQSLPLSVVPLQVDASTRHLVSRFPHAPEIIEILFDGVVSGGVVGRSPILLLGDQGSGKTSICREFGEHLHAHVTIFPCASVSDSSFGGTPAQWATRRVSTPLQAIVRAGVANPILVLDELEKTGQSDRVGSLVHALLPMLEPHTAASYFETALELPADLSAVTFLATANSLAGIPGPLLDRFRVVRMPNPGPEHVEAIAQAVVRGERDARLLHDAELPDFAPDEISVIRRAWGGGSLRRLNRAIDATLRAREAWARARPN